MIRRTSNHSCFGLSLWIVMMVATFSLAYASTGPSGSTSALSEKEKKSGFYSPKPFTGKELTSVAERLRRPSISGIKSAASTAGHSSLNRVVNSGSIGKIYRDSTLFTAREWNIRWHERYGTPISISNLNIGKQSLSLSAGASDAQAAVSFVQRYKTLFRLANPVEELSQISENSDKLGKRHIRLQQVYKGIPVWGHEIIVHKEPGGDVYGVSARYCPTPSDVDLTSDRISADEAVSVAMNDLSGTTAIRTFDGSMARLLHYSLPESELCIWVDENTQKPHLAWFVKFRPNIIDDWYYFIDACSGAVLHKYNNTNSDGPATTSATDLNGISQTINTYLVGSLYYLIDASRPIWQVVQPDIVNDPRGALWTTTFGNTDNGPWSHVMSANNTWNDPVAVSAHYNVGQTFQYYYSTFGRNAIDDSGTTIYSVIHVTKSGVSMDNAYWNYSGFMAYGDGEVKFKPLAGALDVAAHEMTHGVIQHTVNLEYQNQSGALNESFADVFGCMVDRADWFIGEDIVRLSAFPSGAMRNLADPHNGGTNLDGYWQPAHMSEYRSDTADNGGVHINSGIPNRAAYLIGANIGKDKLEQIYYRILDARYIPREGQFIDMRLAAIQSATDLYGSSSTEVATVTAAFDAVGILDGAGTQQPPDVPAPEGEQWVAVVNAESTDHSLYKVKPDSSGVFFQLTATQVNTLTGCPITVTSDGEYVLFVDSGNFIRGIGTDGAEEQVISTGGEWRSIALSPDNRRLAATSIYEDSSIYIFDLEFPDSSKSIHLYCPGSEQGASSNITRYADALDWNLTGEYLIYDALSSVNQTGGGTIDSWSIFLLDVAAGSIYSLFPPLPPGIQMGNPSFASTNDIYVVCDLINTNANTCYIYAVNLFSGVDGLIENNGTSLGYPEYSTDDGRIVFQREEVGGSTLRQINMDANRIIPAGMSSPWLLNAALPTWYVVPSPIDVDDPNHHGGLPDCFSMSQNYPNPFNPTTTIEFQNPQTRPIKATIEVYNILGQQVRRVFD
ncbi:MAG: M4 family metallopeptidase, partial [candidate division Zixibacteria bacterium]|nr:M4 family metallopeptidase [candidate division Zixibacteria bacterium]